MELQQNIGTLVRKYAKSKFPSKSSGISQDFTNISWDHNKTTRKTEYFISDSIVSEHITLQKKEAFVNEYINITFNMDHSFVLDNVVNPTNAIFGIPGMIRNKVSWIPSTIVFPHAGEHQTTIENTHPISNYQPNIELEFSEFEYQADIEIVTKFKGNYGTYLVSLKEHVVSSNHLEIQLESREMYSGFNLFFFLILTIFYHVFLVINNEIIIVL